MKHLRAGLCPFRILAAGGSVASGQTQKGPSGTPKAGAPIPQAAGVLPPTSLDTGAHLNPLKIAELKWYLSNTSTEILAGNQPYGLCFDGANIWSANYGDDTITKIQANDGTILGTFKVGSHPFGILFDGANVWVSNSGFNTVTKLRASDGTTLGTFTVGSGTGGPGWMAFDGQNVWVPFSGGTVTKLRASDGKNMGTFTVAFGAFAAAFAAQNVWVTSGGASTVSELRASNGALIGT